MNNFNHLKNIRIGKCLFVYERCSFYVGGSNFVGKNRYKRCNPVITLSALKFSSRSNASFVDPYKILGVTSTSSLKDIKHAYFREAKKHHPDLNPNDPGAKARFQRVAWAYEILSDEKKRKQYDATGRDPNAGQTYTSSQKQAEDIFQSMLQDLEIINEAWKAYTEDLATDINYAVTAVSEKNDWKPTLAMINNNKGLLLGIILPTIALLRFPFLVTFTLRLVAGTVPLFITGLVRSGHAPRVAAWLWNQIVLLAKSRRNNRKSK